MGRQHVHRLPALSQRAAQRLRLARQGLDAVAAQLLSCSSHCGGPLRDSGTGRASARRPTRAVFPTVLTGTVLSSALGGRRRRETLG
jgi:rare lipoprotein A (peptidoglycan hydrolase)